MLAVLPVAAGLIMWNLNHKRREALAKVVTLKSRNLKFAVATKAETLGKLAEEQSTPFSLPSARQVNLRGEEGELFDASAEVVHGMTLIISKPVEIVYIDGGAEKTLVTAAETVGDLLNEQKIGLSPTDRVRPELTSFLGEGIRVVIDRIVDVEVTENSEIPFEIRLENDPEMFYGREEMVSAGKAGYQERKFLITYKNGAEIRRKLLSQKVLTKPEVELRKFGTKIEIENEETGRASWYAYKKCMCAAHPSYAKGRFVRVISLASGKSIIVRINDRGPDRVIHPDRVIDLDATAFKELAPLGAGTIGVRVDLIKSVK